MSCVIQRWVKASTNFKIIPYVFIVIFDNNGLHTLIIIIITIVRSR